MAKRILIIEDDPGILELLELIFESDGYIVDSSLTGKSVNEIMKLNPDLLVMDVRIEGYKLTGDEICAELKAFIPPNGIPVMLLSAERNLPEIALACNSNSYMRKPFDINDLLETVGKFWK
ncbi:Response regulator receiver domain-containing protein [Pedobacter westerhofensis]|uniref:Response regulator receiver domain-containing protein n=1 Tax=Pedobacter westerhofensis TaxID=425512 RepID=A0A521FLF6_9SPHI|nr:response regulator [Pedobacter westerhofensis]SMO96969.1 Response regulator receiver domain-containing protein [Pedobacter westerhofensis]